MISINPEAASAIYSEALNRIENLRQELDTLDKRILALRDPAEGNWQGAAANKFFADYESVQNMITKQMPDTLKQIADNLNANKTNFEKVDQGGAGI